MKSFILERERRVVRGKEKEERDQPHIQLFLLLTILPPQEIFKVLSETI